MKKVVLLLLFLSLIGCGSLNYNINSGNSLLSKNNLEKIEKGGTTKKEVLALLGEPMMKTQSGVLGEMWTYSKSTQHHYSKNFWQYCFIGKQVSIETISVCIIFDGDIVKDITISEVNPSQTLTYQKL
ncbi:MAG: outer membrane protein assembly factor BamE [Candidatus Omnitrophota bacterium]